MQWEERTPSRAEIQYILSLGRAKERKAEGLFVAEGLKLCADMLGAFPCALLVGTSEALQSIQSQLRALSSGAVERVICVPRSFDFARISSLRTPQGLLALFALPSVGAGQSLREAEGLALLLDGIQDPGNLGTILRTADWFGLRSVWLSQGSVDPYSPKAVQASMAALSRLRVHRLACPTAEALAGYRGRIYGTFLEGENLYSADLPSRADEPCLLVMGSEGSGISAEVARLVTHRITIPPYSPEALGSESLNVGIATALCLGELRRRLK